MAPFNPGHQRRGNRRFDHGNHRDGSGTSNVPSWGQVVPGASVSIVLKADQPTGREVQGTVQDVLTRHDHPRGIKVRLSDGRVGRVQRMAPGAISSAITSIDPTIDTNTLEVRTSNGEAGASQQPLRYRDIRLDDQPEAPPATNDLSAYIKPAKQKKRKGQATKDTAADAPPGSNLSCPVCGDFQGDEAAVAHHVQGHFD